MKRKVALFGGSAPLPDNPQYKLACDIGFQLAKSGFDLVCGGHDGVMEAASKGAHEGGATVTGVTCQAIRDARGVNVNAFVDNILDARDIPQRIDLMVRQAGAYVFMPGGTGTLAELGITLEYIHKKIIIPRPILCVGSFWRPVVDSVAREQSNAIRYMHFAETTDQVVSLVKKEAVCLEPTAQEWRGNEPDLMAMKNNDEFTTVQSLKELVARFVADRNWQQFHDAKNLSASIAIEAAELMEHFQWIHSDAVQSVKEDPRQRNDIREEVADILAYLLSFASAMGIDLSHAIRGKMKKNETKYPADRDYGDFHPKGQRWKGRYDNEDSNT